MIEQYLDEKGIHIGHNRIHKILLEAKLAKEEHRKKNRRKWERKERKQGRNRIKISRRARNILSI
jgi:hypothetical protein